MNLMIRFNLIWSSFFIQYLFSCFPEMPSHQTDNALLLEQLATVSWHFLQTIFLRNRDENPQRMLEYI